MIHGFSLMILLAAATAPTPLYHLYQQTWHFATPWLTAVFAIYAVTLLLALLFGARLSDHLGRRPTIALALLLDMLAMGLFAVATSTVWLLWARAMQGFATGLAMAALGAAMLDLDRQRGAVINSVAPMFGMSMGALGSTALSIRLSSPLHGVYFVLIGVLAFALGLTSVTSETSPRRPVTWASLRPSVGVPVAIRRAFWAVTPINIAVWMLGGFYLSLMPSLVMLATHAGTPWLAGGVVAMLTLTGALGIILALRQPALQVLLGGAGLLLAGTCLIRHGADLASAHEMVAGSLLAGLGFGSAFLGAVRNVLPRAEPHQRSQLMGVFYLESYLAFSLPAMLLGFVAQRQGLLPAMHLYTDAIIVLLVGAIAWIVGQRAHLHHPAA
ncbi:MFS transporter [Frateuria aurantia]